MNYEPKHHDSFPTLVTSFDIEGHESEKTCVEMIDAFNEYGPDHPLVAKGKSSYQKGDEQFLNDHKLIPLWKTIQECIDVYTQHLGVDYSLLSTSWFNSLFNGGAVDAHRHERSIISGAYYPYVDKGSSPIVFRNPNQVNFMNYSPMGLTDYNRYELECFPKTGLVVLFPSWLEHRVITNQTEKRYTVSFNTIRHSDRAAFMNIRDYRIDPHESTDS